MTSELDSGLIEELQSQQVSVVFLDLGHAGANMSNIILDYEQGIEEAITHLRALGHSSIAYIGGPERLRSARKRLEAFQASIKKHLRGMSPMIIEGDFQIEGGYRAAKQMLEGSEHPTAIVVANDLMAMGAIRACHAANLDVPRDISIIGYDDIALAEYSDPPLTTVRVPRVELGKCAVDAVMQAIEHPQQQGVEIHIRTNLVVRESTAQVRV